MRILPILCLLVLFVILSSAAKKEEKRRQATNNFKDFVKSVGAKTATNQIKKRGTKKVGRTAKKAPLKKPENTKKQFGDTEEDNENFSGGIDFDDTPQISLPNEHHQTENANTHSSINSKPIDVIPPSDDSEDGPSFFQDPQENSQQQQKPQEHQAPQHKPQENPQQQASHKIGTNKVNGEGKDSGKKQFNFGGDEDEEDAPGLPPNGFGGGGDFIAPGGFGNGGGNNQPPSPGFGGSPPPGQPVFFNGDDEDDNLPPLPNPDAFDNKIGGGDDQPPPPPGPPSKIHPGFSGPPQGSFGGPPPNGFGQFPFNGDSEDDGPPGHGPFGGPGGPPEHGPFGGPGGPPGHGPFGGHPTAPPGHGPFGGHPTAPPGHGPFGGHPTAPPGHGPFGGHPSPPNGFPNQGGPPGGKPFLEDHEGFDEVDYQGPPPPGPLPVQQLLLDEEEEDDHPGLAGGPDHGPLDNFGSNIPGVNDYDATHGETVADPQFGNDGKYYYYINPNKAYFFAGPKPTAAFTTLNFQLGRIVPCIQSYYDSNSPLSSTTAGNIAEQVLADLVSQGAISCANFGSPNPSQADYAASLGYEVTVVAEDGTVLYNTYAERNSIEITNNYNEYPEVFTAFLNGNEGFASRVSNLSNQFTRYIGKVFFLTVDPTQFFVLRVGKSGTAK